MTSPLSALTSAINDKNARGASDEVTKKPGYKVNWNDAELIKAIMGSAIGRLGAGHLHERHLTSPSFKDEYESDFSALSTVAIEMMVDRSERQKLEAERLKISTYEREMSGANKAVEFSPESKVTTEAPWAKYRVRREDLSCRPETSKLRHQIAASTPRITPGWIERAFEETLANGASTPVLNRSKLNLD